MKSDDVLMSDRYRLYILGWAYIPYQDLPRYEKAYKKVNEIINA